MTSLRVDNLDAADPTVGTFTWTLTTPRAGPDQTRTITVVVGPRG